MRTFSLLALLIASFSAHSGTLFTLRGDLNFSVEANLVFTNAEKTTGIATAQLTKQKTCTGKFFVHKENRLVFFSLSFPLSKDVNDTCWTNNTAITMRETDYENLLQGVEILVDYKSELQMQMQLQGKLSFQANDQ